MINFFKRLFYKKPDFKDLPVTSGLCKCKGSIPFQPKINCEYFPLKSGHHTSFVLGRCGHCKGFAGFPQYNLDLALKEGTDEAISQLKNVGLDLEGVKAKVVLIA